ncbi:MAG TPA: dihydrofolate reductase family protein [Nitrospirota bacterium]|nr:dihydrofolate reductase family protein [Nitrospirota bacterium]
MRKIITTTFVTLDGVVQAPGGPTEDTTGGFAYGGWSVNYWDEMMGTIMKRFMGIPFELLLGKNTYEIFAAYWPHTKEDAVVAEPFNATKKYVVSEQSFEPSWKNSMRIAGDVVKQIKKLKAEDGPDLWVHGSCNLIQTLLKHHLIDRMHLWIFPVTVGGGKKLFAEGTRAEGFKLVESKSSTTGVIIATYESTGALKTGSIPPA